MKRPEILEQVRERKTPWDIIVIGGGATGVGCALDAASRGFDVLLLEQHDFGKGTSSRSTKLIHGGVRYLTQGNLSLIRESLKERAILLKNAPRVVHKQTFIVPCYSLWQKIFYGAGLKIYDLLAGKYSLGRSKVLSKAETLAHLPTVRSEALTGGILYYDAQFDDTRLLIDLVQTAYAHEAAVLNYAKVTSFEKDADGKICGCVFEDVESGESFDVKAKVVINATGTFCDAIRSMSDAGAKPLITYSQGIHLVFDRSFLPSNAALMIPRTSDGRVLFAIPWHGRTLVGTTDTPIDRAELEPHAFEKEIDFVLETAAGYLAKPPKHKDILSVFAGIRPLVKTSAARNTARLSRGHTIEINRSGMLTITGGKWTTYRRMAEDAVDNSIEISGLERRESVTADLAIAGIVSTDSEEKLHPELPYSEADIIRAVRAEMARTVEDVLARRTRALFLNAQAAIEMSANVAAIMAEELGKDNKWVEKEIATFKDLAVSYSCPSA